MLTHKQAALYNIQTDNTNKMAVRKESPKMKEKNNKERMVRKMKKNFLLKMT